MSVSVPVEFIASLSTEAQQKICDDLFFKRVEEGGKRFGGRKIASSQKSITAFLSDETHIHLPFAYCRDQFPDFFQKYQRETNANLMKVPYILRGTLRNTVDCNQPKVVDEARECLQTKRTVWLNMYPGFGKTRIATTMTAICGRKAIIVCNMEVLLKQWYSTFKAVTNARCIVLGGKNKSVYHEEIQALKNEAETTNAKIRQEYEAELKAYDEAFAQYKSSHPQIMTDGDDSGSGSDDDDESEDDDSGSESELEDAMFGDDEDDEDDDDEILAPLRKQRRLERAEKKRQRAAAKKERAARRKERARRHKEREAARARREREIQKILKLKKPKKPKYVKAKRFTRPKLSGNAMEDLDKYDVFICTDRSLPSVFHLAKHIGTLVMDESHQFMTSNRISALLKFHPRYVIACSASLHLIKNGLEPSVYSIIGGADTRIWRPITKPFYVIRFDTNIPIAIKNNYLNEVAYHDTISQAFTSVDRNNLIYMWTRLNVLHHKIMILTLSVPHAIELTEMLRRLLPTYRVNHFTGKTKEMYTDCDVLVGTFSKIGTGFDGATSAPDWDGRQFGLMLFVGMTRSMAWLEQLAGRVFRADLPVMVDFVDACSLLEGHFKERLAWCSLYDSCRTRRVEECATVDEAFLKTIDEDVQYALRKIKLRRFDNGNTNGGKKRSRTEDEEDRAVQPAPPKRSKEEMIAFLKQQAKKV